MTFLDVITGITVSNQFVVVKYCFVILLLSACSGNERTANSNTNANDSTAKEDHTPSLDSTVKYDLDGLSSEGAEASVQYHNSKIQHATLWVYGCSGKQLMQYTFNKDTVEVSERIYSYEKPLAEIKSDADMKLSDSASYKLLMADGRLVKGRDSSRTHTYQQFLKEVPFFLK